MNFDLIRLHKAVLFEKLSDIVALITLKLENLTVLFMLNHIAIAGKVLLAYLEDPFFVELIRDALNGGQGFATVPLLNTNVDGGVSLVWLTVIRERI